VKRKTYKTDWPLLRWVAEHSPKYYAAKIRRRNVGLLRALDKHAWGYSSKFGCPHCGMCCACIWTEGHVALRRRIRQAGQKWLCLDVLFGGIALNDTVVIHYGSSQEALISGEGYIPTLVEIAEARRFLKAHIAWAKKPYWERKLDKQYDK
jgi:hypothetical protein